MRIFSPEEVQKGRVPTVDHINFVLKHIWDQLRDYSSIVHAIVLGSAGRGTIKHTSDIDMVVIYDDTDEEREEQAMLFLRSACDFARLHAVSFEPVPIPISIVETQFHSIGAGYMQHMIRLSKSGMPYVKGNPAGVFVQYNTEQDDLESYLRAKIRSVAEKIMLHGSGVLPDEYEALRSIMITPVHVARRMLSAYVTQFDDDEKSIVIRRYKEVVTPRVYANFELLVLLEREYSADLLRSLAKYDDGQYRGSIEKLWIFAPEVLRFLKDNAQIVLKRNAVLAR